LSFDPEAEATYARLCAFRSDLRPDPHLADRDGDDRRGLSLIARLAPDVAQRLAAVQADLRGVLPGQYYYDRADFHITVLTLISCWSGFDLEPPPPGSLPAGLRAGFDPMPGD
jgi:hypothetical protein